MNFLHAERKIIIHFLIEIEVADDLHLRICLHQWYEYCSLSRGQHLLYYAVKCGCLRYLRAVNLQGIVQKMVPFFQIVDDAMFQTFKRIHQSSQFIPKSHKTAVSFKTSFFDMCTYFCVRPFP